MMLMVYKANIKIFGFLDFNSMFMLLNLNKWALNKAHLYGPSTTYMSFTKKIYQLAWI